MFPPYCSYFVTVFPVNCVFDVFPLSVEDEVVEETMLKQSAERNSAPVKGNQDFYLWLH